MTDHVHQFENPDVLNPTGTPDAFDKASFYIEVLKYDGGAEQITSVTRDVIAAQVAKMVEAGADLQGMEPMELVEACLRYGVQWSTTTQIHPAVTSSIFLDGVFHGIALASGLYRDLPPQTQPPEQPDAA